MANNRRPFSGMAVYSRIEFYPGYPYSRNSNGIEITIIRLITAPHVQIFGIYRSPKVPLTQMCHALSDILISHSSQFNVFIGDFNINWLNNSERISLYNLFIRDHRYIQLVTEYTTDNKTCIDQIYTNIPIGHVKVHTLETYFTDHKAICALIDSVNITF